jgi:hypothetical protein
LIVLVIADHATTGVRGKNLGGQKVGTRKRTLARSAGADQDDEREVGDGYFHNSLGSNHSQAGHMTFIHIA